MIHYVEIMFGDFSLLYFAVQYVFRWLFNIGFKLHFRVLLLVTRI